MPTVHLPSPPSLFPSYLTSPLKFRRKSSSSSSSTNSSSSTSTSPSRTTAELPSPSPSSSSSPSPGPTFLSGSTSRLRCARCLADLALSSQIISKGFTGRHGRAYLVAPPPALSTATEAGAALPNTFIHRAVPRQLVTGLHTVGDISCAQCGSVLGWKYVAAEEEGQRYKVGKFILEGKRVVAWGGWEGEELGSKVEGRRGEEEVEFDSQDEDECEELFMGTWNAAVAGRRRRLKRFGRE